MPPAQLREKYADVFGEVHAVDVSRKMIKLARRAQCPDSFIKRVIQYAKQGFREFDLPEYDTDWQSEAYLTVSGQNSNNSVRVTDAFLKVSALAREKKLYMRDAAYMIAIQRVADACKLRGWV